jgi:hypothetical protein
LKTSTILTFVTVMMGCTTIQEYPLRPHTCQYDGGINISNGHMLQIEALQTPIMRGDIFGDRKSVLIGNQYYSLDSFRPVLMCVNPKMSAEVVRQTELADVEIKRRYAIMGGAALLAPALPITVVPFLVSLGVSASTAGVAGYFHAKFFEPEVARLDEYEVQFNREVAELVRTRNETSPTARLELNQMKSGETLQ